MRVTKRTNIALRVMMFCAANPGRLATKAEISQVCQTSENHLAQVINQLAQIGLLHTQRGRNGGLSLARPPQDVTIGEVFRALEGPLPLAECFSDTDDSCPADLSLPFATGPARRGRGLLCPFGWHHIGCVGL